MQTAALAALLATSAFAAPASLALEQRQDSFSYFSQCDALRQPTWDDCEQIFGDLTAEAGGDGNYLRTPPNPPAQQYVYSNGDCVLSYGWNNRDYEFRQFHLVQAIDTLESQCKVSGAGGVASLYNAGGDIYVSIYSMSSPPANSLQTIPAEDVEAKKNKKTKRENTSWNTVFTVENATPEQYRQQVLDALPGGSTWSITTESSQTSSIESTTELSADLFSLFSATQSISVGYEETLTYSTTQDIPNNCGNDQTGTLYWYPLYTEYRGGWSPDGPSPATIYVPNKNGDSASGVFRVLCGNN
ncbi:hypothetical protein Slin15195_G041310 [Septoria linicola]|uniref:Uncharacterized protein n=1 Tax=Septoria linicola TaxID=215465 RepID=A0A9Q9AK13_9PEZI|nr:hypothetical protein Slin14017_G044830 [Septoria linicola]USW50812.1 hypothetical protein Slin15195_G041310 [Septoria linicola]